MKLIKKYSLVIWFAALSTSMLYAQQSKVYSGFDTSDEAFQKLGIDRTIIKPSEDGMRTTGKKGTYEWWYFDGTLADGSTLVIVFYTKNQINPNKAEEPRVTFELTRPDGSITARAAIVKPGDFSSSKDSCDVRVGTNRFSGNLHQYNIHVEINDVIADVKLEGVVPSWRPSTGFMQFKDDNRENYFAWLPSVPQGRVTGTVSIAEKNQAIAGIGYHDHNWGDISMLKLIHNWYWGRAQAGDYSVIASYITAASKYNYGGQPILMLAQNGKIIADNSKYVTFTPKEIHVDGYSGKPVADVLVYDYNDGVKHYRITFKREKNIVDNKFTSQLHGIKKAIAKIAGFNGAYLRFTGKITIEKLTGNNEVAESASDQSAVWELMYFGHALKN